MHTLGIIGLGLIGASIARDARARGLAAHIIGHDASPGHTREALALGIVDSALAPEAIAARADLLILAIPVDHLLTALPRTLDAIGPRQIVVDVGSTKAALARAVERHPNRPRYVAAHPMAGTERSGPAAAQENLFQDRTLIITDPEKSDPAALQTAADFFTALGARIACLDSTTHDQTAAHLSHMPHLLSYTLARAITQAERQNNLQTQFAGGGLASMTRLAKSPLSMWLPIFRQNRLHTLAALDAYLAELRLTREALASEDPADLETLLKVNAR